MLLTCPQCKTIFRVDRLRLHLAGHAKPRSISAQDSFAGDGDSDLRWVNDIAYTKPHILTAYLPILISGFHRIGIPILPPISKVHFLYGLILTQVPRLKSASSRFHGLFLTRGQPFVAAVKLGTDSSFIISAMGLAPRSRYASPSRTITSAAGDRLL